MGYENYARLEPSKPSTRRAVVAAREIKDIELAAVLGLLLFGLTVPFGFAGYFLYASQHSAQHQPITQEFPIFILLATFAFATVETFGIILLIGYKRIDLPGKFLHWLGGATIGEIATLVAVVLKKVL